MSDELKKVIRDGKVAVLYSPGHGAGWSTWSRDEYIQQTVFDPEIVELVELRDKETDKDKKQDFTRKIMELAEAKWPNFYTGGARDLKIEWVEEGSLIQITEYDGFESIEYRDGTEWIKV